MNYEKDKEMLSGERPAGLTPRLRCPSRPGVLWMVTAVALLLGACAVLAFVRSLLPGPLGWVVLVGNVVLGVNFSKLLDWRLTATECGCMECTETVHYQSWGSWRDGEEFTQLLDTYVARFGRHYTLAPMEIPGLDREQVERDAATLDKGYWLVTSNDVQIERFYDRELPWTDSISEMAARYAPMLVSNEHAAIISLASRHHSLESPVRVFGPFDQTTAEAAASFVASTDVDNAVALARAITAPSGAEA